MPHRPLRSIYVPALNELSCLISSSRVGSRSTLWLGSCTTNSQVRQLDTPLACMYACIACHTWLACTTAEAVRTSGGKFAMPGPGINARGKHSQVHTRAGHMCIGSSNNAAIELNSCRGIAKVWCSGPGDNWDRAVGHELLHYGVDACMVNAQRGRTWDAKESSCRECTGGTSPWKEAPTQRPIGKNLHTTQHTCNPTQHSILPQSGHPGTC